MSSLPDFRKYLRTPHLMEIPNILESNDLQVYEKMDGGNCQVRKHQGRVFCGNRSKFLVREQGFKQEWFSDFHRWVMSNYDFYNLPESVILYGEFMAPHTVPYESQFRNKFFMIDLYDLNSGKFVPYDVARAQIETDMGIGDVFFLDPLKKGKISLNEAKTLALGESSYTSYGREGIVLKDYNQQKFAKLWRTSAYPTHSGLREEIRKTCLGLQGSERYLQDDHSPNNIFDSIVSEVYLELRRSGRKDVSVTEIRDMIRRYS